MAENGVTFVEWREEFVSQERGSRIVHYILKDYCGKSILAVVGTERSLRHMVYVVAEDFLSYSGTDNPVQAGFKWRSRREVVDWLTSLLAKQQQADGAGCGYSKLDCFDHLEGEREWISESLSVFKMNDMSVVALRLCNPVSNKDAMVWSMDRRVKNLKQSYSDVVWIGAAWTCGKQLKHYPAFCRNGTTIAVQAFVFVMAKEGNRYVAYLEDMYEDKKGMKKVKVRWFHHSQEVKGIVRIRNAHPKEVYITPYTQVISVECVDGPAIVLTREHFEKCLEGLPDGLLGKLHLCCRQFRSNKIKPFDLRKLRGYNNQPIISCLESDSFLNSDSVCRGVIGNKVKMFGSNDNVAKGTKRTRNYGDRESFLTTHGAEGFERKKFMRGPFSKNGNTDACDKRLFSLKNGEFQRSHIQFFKVDDKIELLCQDSGIRGCWFRCIVLEISRKQMKLQYRDLEDQDGCGNLEEWIPAFRMAAPDKLGMRCPGRPTIRPCPPISDASDAVDVEFGIGAPVDAWWSDGWWEGVVTVVNSARNDKVQVYVPGENKYLDVLRKDLRVSRDWLGGEWFDVKANPNILSDINAEATQPIVSILGKENAADDSAVKIKDNENEDNLVDLPAPASSVGHAEQISSSDKDDHNAGHHVNDKSDDVSLQDHVNDKSDDEGESGTDDVETAAQADVETAAQAVVENAAQADVENAAQADVETAAQADVETTAQADEVLECTGVA
uniref:BAH domain-containing protein n=1 Tax=Chenopodium quinoa TaxID=63459 RepID=A0A803MWH9_CHEQI